MQLDGITRELALAGYLAEHQGRPFTWGVRDCNTVALGWLDIMAGTSELAAVLDQYSTEAEARQFQLEYGRTLRDVLAGAGLNLVPGGARFARTGDLLLVDVEGEPWTVGHVCTAWELMSIDTGEGCIMLPLASAPAGAELWRCEPCPR